MTDRSTYTVTVHKGAIALMKGESLHAFSSALRQSGAEHVLKKFNIDPKKGGAFPMEVFSTKAVFSVTPDFQKAGGDFMVAMTFKREESGVFAFSDIMKVKAVTSFMPADDMPLTKALDLEHWTPVEESEVKKSVWDGVI